MFYHPQKTVSRKQKHTFRASVTGYLRYQKKFF